MLHIHPVTIVLTLVFSKNIHSVLVSFNEWKTIETLAEQYPYVVAILDFARDYVCTGTIINKRTVLTSGGCINTKPHFIVVGAAIFRKNVNNYSIFEIAFTKLHEDYIFDMQETELNINQMHSNIGLIFTKQPVLDIFLSSASINNYYASELKDKKLIMVGYGDSPNESSEALVLQKQNYYQMPCKNPKWHYCVCGVEYLILTYEKPFGEGAPVLYNDVVVGIAASPSGSLILNRNIHYNIFTVIGPYLPWIERSKLNSVLEFKEKYSSSASQEKIYVKDMNSVIIVIIFNKLTN